MKSIHAIIYTKQVNHTCDVELSLVMCPMSGSKVCPHKKIHIYDVIEQVSLHNIKEVIRTEDEMYSYRKMSRKMSIPMFTRTIDQDEIFLPTKSNMLSMVELRYCK